MHPWEIFTTVGLFDKESWRREFYNESDYDLNADADEARQINHFGHDLDTEAGRRKFGKGCKQIS